MLFLTLLLLFFFSATKYSFAEEKSLYISEINWAGSSSSPADEWLEIYNDSPEDIDLSNYQLSFLTSSGEKYITLFGFVKKYDYYLIANNNKDHIFSSGQSVLNIDPDLVSSSLSLSNTQLLVKLIKQSSIGFDEIDRVGDGKEPYSGQNSLYRSMQRVRNNIGTDSNSFQSTYVCINLDNCENNFGTPKAKNIFVPEINFANNQSNYLINTDFSINYNISFPGNDNRRLDGILYLDGKEIAGGKSQDDKFIFSYNSHKTGCGKLSLITFDQFQIQNTIENEICFYKKFQNLKIRKILANSKSDETEYIEMYNDSDEIIDFENYYIDDKDGGSKPYKLTDMIIYPKSSSKIDLKSKIVLNDSGDEIRILDPNLNVVLKIPFTRSGDGEVLCEENKFENCKIRYLPNVIINSILPYPKYGDEEEIEIENLSNSNVDLVGFYLTDKSNTKFTFKEITLLPKGKIDLKQSISKINLNNTGQEKLSLFNSSGEILSTLEYENAKEGSRYYYLNNKYLWEENSDQQPKIFNTTQTIESADGNDSLLALKTTYQIVNNDQVIDKYLSPNENIKGTKNIDKATEKGYNNILIATFLTIISLWKLYLKVLMKV